VFGGHGKERKRRRKQKSEFVEDVSLLLTGRSLEEAMKASIRVAEEERVSCGGRHSNEQC